MRQTLKKVAGGSLICLKFLFLIDLCSDIFFRVRIFERVTWDSKAILREILARGLSRKIFKNIALWEIYQD